MNMIQIFFVMQFLIFLGIFLYKLYNLMNLGSLYSIQVAFMLHIVAMFCFIIGVLGLFNAFQIMLFSQLITLQSWLYYFIWIFFLCEIFFQYGLQYFFSSKQYKSIDHKND
jgi:hypothetical protein